MSAAEKEENRMEFNEFKKNIKEMIGEKLGMNVRVEECQLQKNNGKENTTSLCIFIVNYESHYLIVNV